MRSKYILGLFLCFMTSISFATSIDGIKPTLQYDEEYLNNANVKTFNASYLNFVLEGYKFPSKTKTGKRQLAKFEKALEIMEEVMNSEEFRTKVISYKRASNGKREYQKNFLWKDSEITFTNEEIYQIIMNGDEKMRPNTIGEMNFNSRVRVCRWNTSPMRWKWCQSVVGSTTPASSKMITLNWKFYKKFEVNQMVANMVHEWLHLLGFLHGKKHMREEVPYVVGTIAGEVAKGIMEGENNLY